MYQKSLFSLIIFYGIGLSLVAQSDSIPTKSVNRDSISLVLDKKPRKALFFGLVLPGGGQVFNQRWWKVPLVYGAYGFAVYRIDATRKRFKEFDDLFKEALATNTKVEVAPGVFFDARQVKINRDRFRDDKDRAVFLMLGVHFLSALEAFVDAHLKNFNIDDDLGFQIMSPSIPGPAIGFTYKLH